MAVESKRNKSKFTTVNEQLAAPKTPDEIGRSITACVNALKGTYGTGTWDGSLGGIAEGTYHQYAMFWDAKIKINATGTVVVTFPYTLIDTVVRVFDVTTSTLRGIYVENSKTVSIPSLSGKTIVEVSLVPNTRDN